MFELSNMFDIASVHRPASTSTYRISPVRGVLGVCLTSARQALVEYYSSSTCCQLYSKKTF